MIQLKRSTPTNTFAFYPDIEINSSIENLLVEYVQDLDKSSGTFNAVIIGKKNWIVGTVSGTSVPSPSGQYTLTIKEAQPGTLLTWGTANIEWQAANIYWDDASGAVPGRTLATERAYIEGSNEATITTYTSPNESGTYTTYNE
jgi:hypothetical protein